MHCGGKNTQFYTHSIKMTCGWSVDEDLGLDYIGRIYL